MRGCRRRRGRFPSAAEAGIIFGALMAPFDFAQGRLWKPCPSRSLVLRWRSWWRRVVLVPSAGSGQAPSAVAASAVMVLAKIGPVTLGCPSGRCAMILSPFQGWLVFTCHPRLTPLRLRSGQAVGCILPPLRGWGGGSWHSSSRCGRSRLRPGGAGPLDSRGRLSPHESGWRKVVKRVIGGEGG